MNGELNKLNYRMVNDSKIVSVLSIMQYWSIGVLGKSSNIYTEGYRMCGIQRTAYSVQCTAYSVQLLRQFHCLCVTRYTSFFYETSDLASIRQLCPLPV